MRRADYLRDSPPMFTNRRLDRLSRVHPAVPALLYLPLILLLTALGLPRSGALSGVGLWLLGYLLWTLVEYWVHRSVFHFSAKSPFTRRLHWLMHGVHHEHPNDPYRLVIPPAVSLPVGALVLFGLRQLLGPDGWMAAGAGFGAGYLAYDMLHFALHHHRARSPLLRALRRRHLRHHFEDERRGFGISAPYWDRVFGTAPPRRPARPPRPTPPPGPPADRSAG
ncbi:sterol desaturase family protein [Streptomyces sp. ODS28]|uniref:sterol desaturase family protein n=1 Tax=Streptomyces sp. ODS28 TaxID=3136688 RepID=UPI0031E91C0C